MTKLMKNKRRNRLTPWSNRMSPWVSEDFQNLFNLDSFVKDDFFEENSLMPAMNVKDHKNDFEIEFAAPGFSTKDFEVSIENDILLVSAEKKEEKEEKDEDFMQKEFSYKSFSRSLTLPENVNLDQDLKANYKNGILKLNLLKKEKGKSPIKKMIEVK